MSLLKNVHIVLVRSQNPINIGQSARAMKNFACPHLSLVQCAFHQTPEAYTVGWKAKKILDSAQISQNFGQVLKGSELSVGFTTRMRGDRSVPVPLSRAIPGIVDAMTSKKVHLVFGNEKNGLSNEELAQCDVMACIPANPIYSSLNLSHAVAIVLSEIFSKTSAAQAFLKKRKRFFATREEFKRLMKEFSEVLMLLDYQNSKKKDLMKTVQSQIEDFFKKAGMEHRELHLFEAFLHRIQDNIHKGKS